MFKSRCRSARFLVASPLSALASLFLVAGCMFERGNGGGSETTVVGVTGKVVDPAGNPVAGAAVMIRPEGALPPGLAGVGRNDVADLPEAYTLADGSFLITDVAPGAYNVECRGQVSGAALVAARVPEADTLVVLADAVLRPTGAIRGRVIAPPDSLVQLNAVYVYIPGIRERAVATRKQGFAFVLGNIPAGTNDFRLQPAFPMELATLKVLEISDLRVESGDTLDLDSLVMPLRVSIADPVYSRDSAAMQAVLRANTSAEPVISVNSAVTGNRITMIYEFNGRLSRIPREIEVLDALEVLFLMGRGFDGTDPILEVAPEIANIKGMRRLWLEGFVLDGLPAWAWPFHELANLMLSNAKLKAFPERVVEYPFLSALDLTVNSISSIPRSIKKLRRLAVMDMSGNELTGLPTELMDMEGLKGFRARNNRLCSLSAEWKVWVSRQDSLWISQADPLTYWVPEGIDSGWEASQRCGESPAR